jgi:hypothetical protein
MPNTYGVPVALCGVPKAEPAAAAVALPTALADAFVDALLEAGALELPELLELQPAAVSASTAMAAAPIGLRCFMRISSLTRCLVGLSSLFVVLSLPGQAAVSPR